MRGLWSWGDPAKGHQTQKEKSMLSDSIKEKGLKLAEDATFYGQPITEMTRDEAIASAALIGKAYTDLLASSLERWKLQTRLSELAHHRL